MFNLWCACREFVSVQSGVRVQYICITEVTRDIDLKWLKPQRGHLRMALVKVHCSPLAAAVMTIKLPHAYFIAALLLSCI